MGDAVVLTTIWPEFLTIAPQVCANRRANKTAIVLEFPHQRRRDYPIEHAHVETAGDAERKKKQKLKALIRLLDRLLLLVKDSECRKAILNQLEATYF